MKTTHFYEVFCFWQSFILHYQMIVENTHFSLFSNLFMCFHWHITKKWFTLQILLNKALLWSEVFILEFQYLSSFQVLSYSVNFMTKQCNHGHYFSMLCRLSMIEHLKNHDLNWKSVEIFLEHIHLMTFCPPWSA